MKIFPQQHQRPDVEKRQSLPQQQAKTWAFTVVAVATTAYAGYTQYQGQKFQQEVAKSTSEYNAKVQENQTIQAEMESRENSNRSRRANRLFMASQRASLAKMGIVESSGSPLEVLGETAATLELQMQDEKRAAESRRRLGFAGAAQTRVEGQAQATAYGLGARATLWQTGAQVAGYGANAYNSRN